MVPNDPLEVAFAAPERVLRVLPLVAVRRQHAPADDGSIRVAERNAAVLWNQRKTPSERRKRCGMSYGVLPAERGDERFHLSGVEGPSVRGCS